MVSTPSLKIQMREEALSAWLNQVLGPVQLFPMKGDASFRRYFRAITGGKSFVIMDAPPPENCQAFAAVAEALRQLGLNTPEIVAMDLAAGFLCLTDFGDDTYLRVLNTDNADGLYGTALEALALLQSCRGNEKLILPNFSAEWMQQEWSWHQEWFLNKWLGFPSEVIDFQLDDCYKHLVSAAASQPQVFMHRDYHAANLMKLPQQQVGILDFQDAFIGPVTYDLVSLLRDCYIDWPETKVNNWVEHYRQHLLRRGALDASVDNAAFQRWFDLMGVQRHLKALMTFARKAVRDQQPAYLAFVPRTLNYLVTVCRTYSELAVLHTFLVTKVYPAVKRKIS